jgi:DNA-binding beta-propeller fold protein YncE
MKLNKSGKLALLAAFFLSIVVTSPGVTASASSVSGTIASLSQARSIAIDPAGIFAYVVEEGGGLNKIDLSNDTIVSRLSPSTNGWDVAINPAGTYAYFIVYNAIKKIDLSNFTVVATITVSRSYNIAINPAGTFAYVTQGSGLAKIDLSTNVVTTVPNLSGTSIFEIAIDSAGAYAYVTDVSLSRMSKIDLVTDSVVHVSIPGLEPNGVAINPAGTFAYVSHYSDTLQTGVLSKIDTSSRSIVASIPVGEGYMGAVAINAGGTLAFVVDNSGSTVAKVNLSNYRKAVSIAVGISPWGIALNPTGTFAYVANTTSGTVSKIAVTRTEAQTITFATVGKAVVPAPLSQLFGSKTVEVSGTASSGLTVGFTSDTTSVCTVSGTTVTFVSTGNCTINANQAGDADWDAATQVSRTFAISPSPPSGETGISINSGASYTNTKSVTLNLVWPEFATEARISNDGGFAASAISTVPLASTVKWDLDDSVKGVYTKVVYVRFSGVGDQSKSYTDDIILDTTAPVVETPSAAAALGSIEVSLKATDDISGVDKVEVKNGTTSVVKTYETKVSVTEKEIGLAVSTASVRKSESSSIEVRVSDKAGNWSAYQTLAVYRAGSSTVNTPTVVTPTVVTPKVVAPKVTTSKSVTAKSIATFAKLTVLSTSKVTLKVISGYSKFCKVSGTSLKGLKAGTCKVAVTVKPKKGASKSKTVSLKVTK